MKNIGFVFLAIGLKLPEAKPSEDSCGCQCSNLIYRDGDGKVYGNCQSKDDSGAQWCFAEAGSTCQDLQTSAKGPYDKDWSYEACTTPECLSTKPTTTETGAKESAAAPILDEKETTMVISEFPDGFWTNGDPRGARWRPISAGLIQELKTASNITDSSCSTIPYKTVSPSSPCNETCILNTTILGDPVTGCADRAPDDMYFKFDNATGHLEQFDLYCPSPPPGTIYSWLSIPYWNLNYCPSKIMQIESYPLCCLHYYVYNDKRTQPFCCETLYLC